MRTPFAPRASAETICALSISLGGMASAWSIVGALSPFGEAWSFFAVSYALALSAIAAIVLSFWIASADSVESLILRSLLGSPVAAALSFALPLGFDLLPATLAAAIGFGFGLACLWPALELAAARRERAHSVRDVQLVNTATWLAIVSASGVMLYPVLPFALLPMVIALGSFAVGLIATLRWVLRRRWLRRVFDGHDPEWSIARGEGFDADLPVIELFACWGDERTLVRIVPPVGSAYRTAGTRQAVARVVPASPM